MTEQEVFNKVWQHFAVEKNPRSFLRGICAYRGKNNAKCAIGIFIPDERYCSALEGYGVQSFDFNLLKTCGLHNVREDFLKGLQHCHDGAFDHNEMIVSLRLLADKWKLTIPD